MKATLLILYLFVTTLAYSQTKKYGFSIHRDALVLLDTNERDTILQRLDGFLTHKNGPVQTNPFIYPDYAKRTLNPFELFYNVESDGYTANFYKPTVLAVLPAIKNQQYVIKISYIGITEKQEADQRILYTLVADKKDGQYYFFNALEYNTRHWGKKQVKSIQYIYPNQLNMAKARQMAKANKVLAKKFSIPVLPITYYRCDDPEQLLKMMGCDYIGNMYLSMIAGFSQFWTNTILAGNNSELYVHELVHCYTYKVFPRSTNIMGEGYATYVGGSGGLALPQLKKLAQEYLANKPGVDITQSFKTFERVKNSIPFTYIASALVCQDVENRYGFEKIKTLFEAQTDEAYFKTLQTITGVSLENFPNYISGLVHSK